MMHLSIVQTSLTLRSVFNVFLFESFNIRKYGLWYWQEDGGSLLTTSFMAIAEQRHKVLKLSKRVFTVFVKICEICFYDVNVNDNVNGVFCGMFL